MKSQRAYISRTRGGSDTGTRKKSNNKEVEIRFINIDQNKLKKQLKEIGGKVYQKRYKMEVIHYKHPTKNYTVRLRDEEPTLHV